MVSESLSSASKAASSAARSGTSKAVSAANEASASLAAASVQASASLASGSAKASNHASNLAKDVPTPSTGFVSRSTLILTALGIVIGAAYSYGYLDSLLAYIQQLLNQARDEKERAVKEQTGTKSTRAAAKHLINQGTVKTEDMSNKLHAEVQQTEQNRREVQGDGPVSLLSSATH